MNSASTVEQPTQHAPLESPRVSLFRASAIEAQRVSEYGRIVLSQPLSYSFLVAIAAIMASALILLAFFGAYTKRTTVAGQVIPSHGVVKVYAQQHGIIVDTRVEEGQRVRRGDVMFVLSSERSSAMGETQALLTEQARLRQQSLREQLDKTQRLLAVERDALRQRIDALQAELTRSDALIGGQRERVRLSEQLMTRYEQLARDGFVTQDQLVQRRAELLDQRARLENLERDRIATSRQLQDAHSSLEATPLEYGNKLAELKRGIATTEEDLTESEARRTLSVIATQDGVVTAITGRKGQVADAAKPLASIIPHASAWQAELYAPSRAVGFIKPGDVVRLRYQAYPYQKFGQYSGRVTQIATTALTSAELTGVTMFGASAGGESLYRISVELDSQYITAYGKPQSLQAGMLLDADILQERRRLYEWVLEPLYSLSGKL